MLRTYLLDILLDICFALLSLHSPFAQVFSYCRHGRLEEVQAALAGGFDVCGQRDENGNTLLHCAAQNGLRSMCKAVLQDGKGSPLNLKNVMASTVAFDIPSMPFCCASLVASYGGPVLSLRVYSLYEANFTESML